MTDTGFSANRRTVPIHLRIGAFGPMVEQCDAAGAGEVAEPDRVLRRGVPEERFLGHLLGPEVGVVARRAGRRL